LKAARHQPWLLAGRPLQVKRCSLAPHHACLLTCSSQVDVPTTLHWIQGGLWPMPLSYPRHICDALKLPAAVADMSCRYARATAMLLQQQRGRHLRLPQQLWLCSRCCST
jgi:hypothetical protein